MADPFDALTIGTMTARNRLVRAATAESLATPDGRLTPELLGLYGELAWGGVGTIITGYMYVTYDGKPAEGALGLYDDGSIHRLRNLTDLVHENGARIVAQLVYGGSKSKLAPGDSRRLAPAGAPAGAPTDAPGEDGVPNTSILGASAVVNPRTALVPTEATADDLHALAAAFGQAALRARASGFDGVEVHAAHGYLLSQFLSARFNRRADRYGGSLENRARFACECVAAARKAVGSGFPVLVKLNCWDDFDDPAGEQGGLGEDESAQAAALLVQAGASAIDVSGDWHAASLAQAQASASGPFFSDFGARLARELDAPVIVTGGWRSLDAIRDHLEADGIAAVGMSRPFICEPDLPRRWQAADFAPSRCIGCGHCMKFAGIPCALKLRE